MPSLEHSKFTYPTHTPVRFLVSAPPNGSSLFIELFRLAVRVLYEIQVGPHYSKIIVREQMLVTYSLALVPTYSQYPAVQVRRCTRPLKERNLG